MTTQNQLEANRRNAQHSTGPKTDAGKAATSRNALKHGLLAEKHVLLDESPEDFTQFIDGFLADLAPDSPMETHLAKIVATTAFRLQRVPRIEIEMFNARMTKFTDAPYKDNPLGAAFTYNASDAIKTLTRYESSLNRQFNTALKQLTALKATHLGTPSTSSASSPPLGTPLPSSASSPAELLNKPISPLYVADNTLSQNKLLDRALPDKIGFNNLPSPLPGLSQADYEAALAGQAVMPTTKGARQRQ